MMTIATMTSNDLRAGAILAEDTAGEMASDNAMSSSPNHERWNSVITRNAAHDGKFVFAVATTGVYCRPSCPARRPRRENVTFFTHPDQAEKAGFRACLRCRPRLLSGSPQSDTVKAICRYIEQHLDEATTLQQLGRAFHQSPFHLQRRFKAALGITPRQ